MTYQNCCVNIIERQTQRYRSGHNEAVLKTVWVHAHVGSNPTLCAKEKEQVTDLFFFLLYNGIRTQGVPEKSQTFWGEEKHMQQSLAKATAFCFDCGMCFDEIPPSAPKKKNRLQTCSFFFYTTGFEPKGSLKSRRLFMSSSLSKKKRYRSYERYLFLAQKERLARRC